jgi:hypothetical protein
MARSSRGATLLFWLMALTGTATLAACLILPPWLEHQAALRAHADARRHVAELEARVQVLEKHIAHLRNDPAYVERLAHEEFGITTPGVQTILLDRSEGAASDPASEDTSAGTVGPGEEQTPDVSALVTEALECRPLVSVFVLDQTRPIVMAMSAALLLAAFLLFRTRRR